MKFVITRASNYYGIPCDEAYIDNSVRVLGDTDVYVIDLEESISMFYTIPEIVIYDDYIE